MKIQVSFDFDATLNRNAIQKYAKSLIEAGVEVWVCTARFKVNPYSFRDNKDLYAITDLLGILREHIIFTNMIDKINFIKNFNFLWHLDDDLIELNLINSKTKIKGIYSYGKNWKNKCQRLINNKLNDNNKRSV